MTKQRRSMRPNKSSANHKSDGLTPLARKIRFLEYSRDIVGMLGGWRRIYEALKSKKDREFVLEFGSAMFEEVHELAGYPKEKWPAATKLFVEGVSGQKHVADVAIKCAELMFDTTLGELKSVGGPDLCFVFEDPR
ncbi:MAG: hypothetical protein VX528_01430 [Candidatus Latescibacterota bacterium]|nr:hypothetical protein [Candidatus Latescibacterota bacterium]